MSETSRYREFLPCPRLRRHVACYWTSRVPEPSGEYRVLPDGCIDILFDLSNHSAPTARMVGTMTQALLFRPTGPVNLVAVRFQPGGAVPFLGINACEITDAQHELVGDWDVGDWDIARLCELANEPSIGSGIHSGVRNTTRPPAVTAVEQLLLNRLVTLRSFDRRIEFAVQQLAARNQTVENLAREMDISRQGLGKLFRQQVGVSPKVFQRVMRLQQVVDVVQNNQPIDWTAVALDAGYYDQSHLINECRQLAGVPPTQL